MRFLKMVKADVTMTLRNKQSLFWMLAFPIIIMSLLGIVFGNEQTSSKLGIVNNDNSELSRNIIKGFGEVKNLNTVKGSEKSLMSRLKNGKIDAVLVIKKDFAKEIPLKPAKMFLYYDPSSTLTSQMARMTVNGLVGEVDRQMIKAPHLLQVKSKKVQARQFNYIDFLLPGILAMSLMNSGIFGISNTMIAYREKGVLRRLKITPLPLSIFIGAGIVNQLFVAILQAALLMAVGHFAFGAKIAGDVIYLSAVIVVGSLCFVTVGYTIASFAKTVEVGDTLGNIVGMPMMFLSGVFFPVDNAPTWIQPVIKLLPLKYLADALRAIMVRDQSLYSVRFELLILAAVTLVLFFVSVKFFKWESNAG